MATRCTKRPQGSRDSRRSARRPHNLTISSTSDEATELHDERASSRSSHEHVHFAATSSEEAMPACSSRVSEGGSLKSVLHAPRLDREASLNDAPEIRAEAHQSHSRPRHLVRESTKHLIQQLGAVLPINQARFGERVPYSFHKNTFQKQKEGCSRNSWRNSLRANEIIPKLLQSQIHMFLLLGLLVNAAVILVFAGLFCMRLALPPPRERRAVSPARPLCLQRIGRVGGALTRRCGTCRVPILSR